MKHTFLKTSLTPGVPVLGVADSGFFDRGSAQPIPLDDQTQSLPPKEEDRVAPISANTRVS